MELASPRHDFQFLIMRVTILLVHDLKKDTWRRDKASRGKGIGKSEWEFERRYLADQKYLGKSSTLAKGIGRSGNGYCTFYGLSNK